MRVAIIGAGYVGLVTGAVFASFNNKVSVVDLNEDKVSLLREGSLPFFEPKLEHLIKNGLKSKSLSFTTDCKQAVNKAKIVFICVGTPNSKNGEVDLTQLYSALREVARSLRNNSVIAIKSTVPIGVETKLKTIVKRYSQNNLEIVVVPEFLREGTAVDDAFHPDRIVIGVENLRSKAVDLVLDLYKRLPGERIICDLRSAQLIKYAANSFLATKISFANAVSRIAEKVGADAKKVLIGVGLDKRIGSSHLNPGVGYGGSCLPKDVVAFINISKKIGYDFGLLKEVDRVNQEQVKNFVKRIISKLNNKLDGKRIAILGLSFKPGTDDIREAPSLKIIKMFLDAGCEVTAFDPVAIPNVNKTNLGPKIKFADDAYAAAKDADCLVIVTEWEEFANLDLLKIKKLMKTPLIADGRNIYNSDEVRALGFDYLSVGV
ncbi:MAG: UDP-glucose/GDP-mannose dehydrogenase family protein [Candidatus Aenigmatarchaeota archaeon]